MKILMKIILTICIFTLVILIIFPASPLRSWYSKIVLSNETILSQLGLDNNSCNYEEPVLLISPRRAAIVCTTTNRYKSNSDDQKTAIDEMRSVLDKNSWVFSSTESWQFWDIVYRKGGRQIRIYPYDWGQGCEGDNCKLLVRLE